MNLNYHEEHLTKLETENGLIYTKPLQSFINSIIKSITKFLRRPI